MYFTIIIIKSHHEDNLQNEKKIFANHSSGKGIVSKTYNAKKDKLIFKTRKRCEQTFLKKYI